MFFPEIDLKNCQFHLFLFSGEGSLSPLLIIKKGCIVCSSYFMEEFGVQTGGKNLKALHHYWTKIFVDGLQQEVGMLTMK